MSDLVVVSFKGEETADQVLTKLQQMQKEHLIDLEDACVVVRSAKGKVHLKQAVDLVKIGALSGAAWGGMFGALVGLMLLNPLVGLATGMAIGASTGALSGALSDYCAGDRTGTTINLVSVSPSRAGCQSLAHFGSGRVYPRVQVSTRMPALLARSTSGRYTHGSVSAATPLLAWTCYVLD